MRRLLNTLLDHRAKGLANRLEPFINTSRTLLDIGSGTGHNARVLEFRHGCKVEQTDVVDMSVVGPPPRLFDGRTLPYPDNACDTGLMLFILHYSSDPAALLSEARRVLARCLIVIQSTYQTRAGLMTLRTRELLQGRFAFRMACRTGLVKPCACPLNPIRFMSRDTLEPLFRLSGWSILCRQPAYWPLVGLSRDLYVLEKP